MIGILNIILGSGLVLAGRRLFWLFVGAIGFLIGIEVATRITFQSELFMILAVVGIGFVFALLAIFLESVAIGMAGFLGGGFGAMGLMRVLGFDATATRFLTFIAGGIIGVFLVVLLFNWALITISSVTGASMIAANLLLSPVERSLIFIALVILGVVFQGFTLRREGKPPATKVIPQD
ncbi:MAG TPA: hypothetical protein VIU38_06585 [Anaerolineales bacterium]